MNQEVPQTETCSPANLSDSSSSRLSPLPSLPLFPILGLLPSVRVTSTALLNTLPLCLPPPLHPSSSKMEESLLIFISECFNKFVCNFRYAPKKKKKRGRANSTALATACETRATPAFLVEARLNERGTQKSGVSIAFADEEYNNLICTYILRDAALVFRQACDVEGK